MRSLIQRQAKKQAVIKVIKNVIPDKEADEIADRWAEHKGPRMTLAETLAHATQFQNVEKTSK